MTICGYHPLMGEGLEQFGQGLIAALSDKARQNKRDLGKHLEHELEEITILSRYLEDLVVDARDEEERRAARGFLGLVYICRFLMSDLNDVDRMRNNLEGFISANCERFVDILRTFEDSFDRSPSTSSLVKARTAWESIVHLRNG